jgi:exopolysaccharide biosynthesis polyprenyl glycosylphosphotransferase
MVVLESVTGEVDTGVVTRRRKSRQGRPHQYTFVIVDAFAAAIAAMAIYAAHEGGLALARQSSVTRNVLTVLMPAMWIVALALHRAYDRSSVEHAAKARGRVVQAALTLIAAMSSACLALHYTALMDQILFGVPVAAILTVLLRQLTVRWWRARGGEAYLRRAIIVGPVTPLGGLIAAMGRDRTHDVRVVAACLVDGATDDQIAALPVPVYGDLSDVPGTARAAGCDTVIVSPCAQLDPIQLRRLGWDLHDAGIELLVAPALSEIARERVEVLPAGGVPLLHVRAPVLSGPKRILKGFLDRIAAVVLLVLAAPVMITVAVLIRATSTGPALFRQRRVGRAGNEFTCLKFRTMTVDAEARRHELAHLNERQDGLLFKIRQDPRITRIGAVLRKYSIDELPQLINVVSGDMSLVGPRPPLPQEVAGYDDAMRRRLLVKPGLTGLWQVSGRSELSWAESVRLDLSYVDNWSPALDARILWRTAAAVIKGTGAY